jgi:hypothetical protein
MLQPPLRDLNVTGAVCERSQRSTLFKGFHQCYSGYCCVRT